MTENEIQRLEAVMPNAASVVKLVCGVGNNVAWLVTLDALDHARQCKGYKQGVKRAFKLAMDEWHNYEKKLIYAKKNRMFHVADMDEKCRKSYGDISDREYYDMWASVGAPAYTKTRPLITSLCNKYRLRLEAHEIKESEHIAWLLTASTAMDLAVYLLDNAIKQVVTDYNIPVALARKIFAPFSVDAQMKAWERAVKMLQPTQYELDDVEKRNIEMGVEQLSSAWMEPSILYNSVIDCVADYGEVFRTKGFQKKAIREISQVRNQVLEELEK